MKKILSAVLVAVMLLLAASAAFGDDLDDILDHMYVNCANGKTLNLRDAPGGKVIAQLDNGTKVWISGGFISMDWVAVTVKLKGKYVEGFVKNEFLQSKKPGKYEITEREDNFEDVKPYVVTAKALNAKTDNSVGLRVKPNKTAKSIRRLTAGDQLTVLSSGRVWLKVLDQETGKIGYVADDYMIFDHFVEDEVEDEAEDEFEAAEEDGEDVAFTIEDAASGAMTYADYAAAETETEVTVETYIQACAYAPAYGNASAFCQTEDGAVYLYRLPCDDELAAKLVPGTKVRVTGFKSEWSGEVEIIDISAIEVLDAEAYIAPAADVTDLLGTDELINFMNRFVSFTDLEVVAYNEAGDAFSYAWDGSGSRDANSDLYFNVSFGGNTYGFTVESDECDNTTAVYAAVEGLKVGDKIDAEAFLYWYNGANPHVTNIIVK